MAINLSPSGARKIPGAAGKLKCAWTSLISDFVFDFVFDYDFVRARAEWNTVGEPLVNRS